MGSARMPGARGLASLAAACACLASLVLVIASPGARAAEPSPAPVSLPPIIDLAMGSQHGCVIVEGGAVWCWGFATDGALGAGPEVTSTDVPLRVQLARPAVAIDAGFEGTCAITDDGAAWCWGSNGSGEVGDGTTENRFVPVQVVGLPGPAIDISRGHDHACAILDDGSGWCWGDDAVGELGDGRAVGNPASRPTPVRIAGVPRLGAVSAAGSFTCALDDGGGAWCWGTSLRGVLGRPDGSDSRTPGRVTGLDAGVDSLVAGDDQACAIRSGTLLCWGLIFEALASPDPQAAIRRSPEVIDVGAPVVEVALENGYHRCARDAVGATWCWGNAEVRQLGPSVAQSTAWVSVPVRQEIPPVTAVATGYDVTCALVRTEDLRCWGDGDPVARNPWTGATGPEPGGFREPGPLVAEITTYIPTPRDISTDPPVIGTNLLLAAAVMLLFTIAGELLNRTLAEGEDAIAARGGIMARLRRARGRLDGALSRYLGRGRLFDVIRLAGIAAIYGLVFSLLDQTWDPLSITGLWLFLSMAVAFGVVGIADDLACWTVARRWGVAAELDLRPGNLLVAVASTFASRMGTLVPGVMIGMPEALDVRFDALDERRRVRLAAASLGTLAVIGALSWAVTLGTSLIGGGGTQGAAVLVGGVEAFCLVVFAVTVQNGFAQLLAFRGTPGRILRTTHRWPWLASLLLVTFLFWHTLVNPRGDLAAALRATNVLAFVGTAAGFVVLATAVWLIFRLRRPRVPEAYEAPASIAPAPEASTSIAVAAPSSVTPAPAAPVPHVPTPAASPPVGAPVVAQVVDATAAQPAPDIASIPAQTALEFDLRAVGDRRLYGRVQLRIRRDCLSLAGSWVRTRDDRAQRIVSGVVTALVVVGLAGIAILTTVPGFRFYRVPWLLPSVGVVAIGLAVAAGLVRLALVRRRWSGEVTVPAPLLVGVRRSFDRGSLLAACIFLTPIGGALYAALVGRTVVRLRGPFDPERGAAIEVRLRCRDRDEAADIIARVRAIRGGAQLEVT